MLFSKLLMRSLQNDIDIGGSAKSDGPKSDEVNKEFDSADIN